jgi:hypothetical protein
MHQRYFLQMAAAGATASILGRLGSAAAQPYAAGRQIRLIVPFPSGGPPDIVGRPLAQMLGDGLGVHLHYFRKMKLLSGAMPCARPAQRSNDFHAPQR